MDRSELHPGADVAARATVHEWLVDVIADLYEYQVEELPPSVDLVADLDLDSLDLTEILYRGQLSFGIDLTGVEWPSPLILESVAQCMWAVLAARGEAR